MKKRILSILLCLCMVACMLPTVAFAADTGKAIRLVNTNNPTGGILGYKNNNNSYDYIYMGSYNSSPVKWRVLDDQTNTGATGLFLLSEDLLGSGGHGDVYDVYFDGTSPYSNAWQGSDAQGWCNTFESSNLDSRELAAILSTTKSDEAFTSSTHNASFAASTNILNSDQVFFLSAQEAENGQYGFTDEAARVANYGAYASVWWLRSPFAKFTSSAGAVDGLGRVYDCGVGIVWAARPAFNLNLNSVLFTSAAVGGKPNGGLTAVPEYSGNEWKLTLLDSSRNFAVTEKTVSAAPDDTVTLNYKGATTGANEYISAIIADNNGAQYYGRVAQPTAESGTVEIKIPSDIAPGNYTLKVFSEQYNGDYKTDYASNFTDIALTVEKQVEEQFSLTPGGTYYFDLSAMNIPGTGNGDLPDSTLHYVPFTYVGTVNAYKLTSETATTNEYAQQNKYAHSLFVADYAVTHKVNWNNLDTASLIFGKDYVAGGVDYTLRAPSVGSNYTGSGNSERGVPQSNEWDTMLNKDSGYIQNWNGMYSWGQDAFSGGASYRAIRGYNSARIWVSINAAYSSPDVGFRPVLEVLNADTLGPDGLKVVTLDLGGGTLGGSSDAIQIIVKNGSEFTAPASDGLTRPDGDTGSYFKWLGSDGKLYAPGDSVPADVTELTVQWTAPTYTVTLHANGGTINNGNVTEYTYGVGATLPTDVTRTGYTFKGWYYNENLTGSPVTAIGGTETGNKEYWAKWEINQYTITFDTNGGSEIAPITQDYGTAITAPANPTRKGYTFKGWDKEILKTMPAENMTVKAQWEINQYAITFDTNGGSEIAPITQDYGTKITAPADPTRKGYTFKGWDKEIPETMPAENITVKAQWEINQYTIAFDTNGGSEIAPITQDYGTNITAPADPTREGYTFIGWDTEIPKTVPAENMTVTAQWEINRYTITFDTAGGSEIAPITQDYGTNITAPADPTREGYTFIGWDRDIPVTMPAENITLKARWKDSEKPTGEIIIGTNKWNKFLNELTFGIFFKDTQEVTINAVDNSGTVFVSYLVTDKELSEAELDSLVFRAYEEPFCIDPNGEYIVYVMLVDENINITYLRSDRLTLDNIHPVIGGIENGKTYCEAQTVTITEKYVDTVTVNGTEVTLDENNSFTLAPADGEQKIVVTDKAGNTAEMTVTVNDGHTYGEWVSNGDGTHTRQCTADGCTEGIETDNCTDEDKNHICDICGNIISNHEDANQDHVCDLCGKVISNHEDADKDHVCDHCGKVISNHEDADNNHICDYCEKVISNHEDADKDHICDLCGKTISNHEDADNNHICDYCGKTISNHEDADKDHICDHCGKVISNHEDANKDHVCELCGKTISNHEDADKDHVCDYCGKVITNHIGGKETCRDKAVCEVCGKSYGKLDPKNHTDLKHFPAKAATEDSEGNIEYWYCSGCNKYYSDKDGTKEIAKADTVTAKLPKSPPTGDNSNLMLWIALLFISGGVLTGVTVFDKRKRHSVK